LHAEHAPTTAAERIRETPGLRPAAAIARRRPGVAVRATGSRLADARGEAGSSHDA